MHRRPPGRASGDARSGISPFQADVFSASPRRAGVRTPPAPGTRTWSRDDGNGERWGGEGQPGEEGGRAAAQAGPEGRDPPEAGQRPDAVTGDPDALRGRETRRGPVRGAEPEPARRQPPLGPAA